MEFGCKKRSLIPGSAAALVTLVCVLVVAACSSPMSKKDAAPRYPVKKHGPEKVVPKVEPRSKYGNPASYVVFGKRYYTLSSAKGYVEQGIASWYGTKFHGRRTSSGETYDMYAMTAAHKTLPLPTYARVTNLKNGRSIIVRINDRGPFHENRIIDLSYTAATRLGIANTGTGLVEVRAIDPRVSDETLTTARASSAVKNPSSLPDLITDSNTTTASSNLPVETAVPAALNTDRLNPSDKETSVQTQALGIYVQLGAFRSYSNAKKLLDAFSRQSLGEVKIHQAELDQAPIYKVWVGPMQSVEQADQTVEKINQLGYKQYKVVFQNQS